MAVMHVKRKHIAILVTLSAVVALLEGVSIGLLVPLAEGIMKGDFAQTFLPVTLSRLLTHALQSVGVTISGAAAFFLLAILIGGVNLLSIAVTFLYAWYGQYLQGMYQWHLHNFVYGRYFSFGKLFFDKTSQGSIKKVMEYTARIVELVRIIQNNLTNVMHLLVYLGIMTLLAWQLMLVIALVFPVLYWASRPIMRRVDRMWQQAKEVTMELGRESFNMLSALPLVWSFSREAQAQKKYTAMSEEFRRVQLKAQSLGYATVLIPRLLTLVALLIIIGFISLAMHRGQPMNPTRVIVFLYVVSRTVPLVKVFNTIWVVVSEMTPPILEVMHLISDKGKYIVQEGKRTFPGLREAVHISHLTFAYEGEPILRDVSFVIPRGKLTALVGPSGSGKTTIINLLMRFYDCPPGTILLDGIDIREFTFKSLRRHMAVVDQDPILLHDTLCNNLLFGQDHLSKAQINEAIDRVQLRPLLNRLSHGLNTIIGDRGVQLSGGEKQRVAIARAILKGAELILLDEATSALDSTTERQVQQTLNQALAGKTALVIAHRLSTVQRADQLVYLAAGRVEEQGTLAELLAQQGAFAQQWQTQMTR